MEDKIAMLEYQKEKQLFSPDISERFAL